MSSTPAIALVLAIYVVALAPVALAYWRPGPAGAVIGLSGLLLLGFATYQTGPFFGDRRLNVPGGGIKPDSASSGRCGQVMGLLERERVILERSSDRLAVAQSLWEQLPEEVRNAVVACAEAERPVGANAKPIEVVLQAN